jgi:hypothetical protein
MHFTIFLATGRRLDRLSDPFDCVTIRKAAAARVVRALPGMDLHGTFPYTFRLVQLHEFR